MPGVNICVGAFQTSLHSQSKDQIWPRFYIFFQFVGVKSDSRADVSALISGVDLLLHSPLFFQASIGESEITVQKH